MKLQSNLGNHNPPRTHFVDILRYWASERPNDFAYRFTDAEQRHEQLTYAELSERVEGLAGYLQSKGATGERVLLLYPPGLDFVVGFYACHAAGAIAVPAYPPRKNRRASRIRSIAQDAEARFGLSVANLVEQITTNSLQSEELSEVELIATDDPQASDRAAYRPLLIKPSDVALLQYTSGSTGSPKGVVLSHENLVKNCELITYAFEAKPHQIGATWLPTYHDMGLVGGILNPMFIGKTNVLMSPMTFLQKPVRWLQAISHYNVSISGGPNFSFQLCVDKVSDEELVGLDLSCWETAFNGAEPIRERTLRAFADRFGPCGFDYKAFLPCYGMAETTLIVTGGPGATRPVLRKFAGRSLDMGLAIPCDETESELCTSPTGAADKTWKDNRSATIGDAANSDAANSDAANSDAARMLVGCGAVLPSEQVAIVDPESREVRPPGQIGEIWVQSPCVGQGYYRKPEETKKTFQAHTADGAGPFLRTGDLGFLHEGQLFVTGRIKDMIIVRGVNRYPQDIEQTVERASAAVQAGSVAAVAVDQDGRENLMIVAETTRQRDYDWDAEISAIRRAVTAEHELPPDAVFLVRNSSVPKTSSGKIQRHACHQAIVNNELRIIAYWSRFESINRITAFGDNTAAGANANAGHSSDSLVMQAAASGTSYNDPRAEAHASGNGTPAEGYRGDLNGDLNGESSHGSNGQVNRDVIEIVKYHVNQVAKERAGELTADTNIVLDLGLDSLERLEIAHNLEQAFGGRFPEETLQEIDTVKEVAAAIEQHMGAAEIQRVLKEGVHATPNRINGTTSDATRVNGVHREIKPEEFRFDQLPEYRRLKQTMAQVELTGIPNPYFTIHQGTVRDTTQIGERELISFSSYNYLGFSGDPEVNAAAAEAIQRYGTSVSASRLVSGEKPIHGELECEIAGFVGVDSALVFVGGHSTNETVIGHLVGPGDLILHDSLSHNSIVQGAILSGARRRPFPHNDFAALDQLLDEVRGQYRRVMVIVEGTYSMDGDFPELPEFIRIKKKHKCFLMVDEAHSIGTLGARGHGIAEEFGVDPRDVDVWMGTLSKSFASCGGYIAGPAELIELLRYTAPGFVFSVGMPPSAAAAALAAMQILQREPERVEQLRQRSSQFLRRAKALGFDCGASGGTPVIPIITGNSLLALRLSHRLFKDGVNVQPILYPAVEEAAARLRFFITSAHTPEQIEKTISLLARHGTDLGIIGQPNVNTRFPAASI